jgi:hypothetical protein
MLNYGQCPSAGACCPPSHPGCTIDRTCCLAGWSRCSLLVCRPPGGSCCGSAACPAGGTCCPNKNGCCVPGQICCDDGCKFILFLKDATKNNMPKLSLRRLSSGLAMRQWRAVPDANDGLKHEHPIQHWSYHSDLRIDNSNYHQMQEYSNHRPTNAHCHCHCRPSF